MAVQIEKPNSSAMAKGFLISMMELNALKNGIFALYSDNIVLIRNWGFYLFGKEFDNEQPLRNKIGVIWLASLADSLEGESRVLGKYLEEASSQNLPTLVALCHKAKEFMDTVREVLSLYSREEQLFVRDLRDQYVHSWLARRHNESFDIKYFNGETVVTEKVARASYYEALSPFYTHVGGLDAVLTPLLERATKAQLRYWIAVGQLKEQMPRLEQIIMEG